MDRTSGWGFEGSAAEGASIVVVMVATVADSFAGCGIEGDIGAKSLGIDIDCSTLACCLAVVCSEERNGNCIGVFGDPRDTVAATRRIVCEDWFRTFWDCVVR